MNDFVYNHLIALTGVMFAAIIAGFFSFVGLISSKENKVSEFRQEWINSLRNSISQYISALYYLSLLNINKYEKRPNKLKVLKSLEEPYFKINSAYNDIIFRINYNEKHEEAKNINDAFLSTLEVTRSYYNKNEFTKVIDSCEVLRDKAKPLLKLEWERVKSGERKYRYSRNIAIFVLTIGFIGFLICAIIILENGKYEPEKKILKVELLNNSNADSLSKKNNGGTMKPRLKLLPGIIALLFVVSCEPKDFLLPEEKEQIFSHDVQLKKEDIKVQVFQFINEKFISGKSVSQSSEEGLIAGNGIFELDRANTIIVGTLTVQMELTFLVKYIDNHYKTKYIVKRLIYTGSDGLPTNLKENWWGKYKEQVNKTIKNMDSDLLNYLTKKDDKFKF